MKKLIPLILIIIIISSSAKSQRNYSQSDYNLYVDNLGRGLISQKDLKLIISCKKNKIKNGVKQGRIEQVVVRGEIKFLDDFKYIPDIEKSLLVEADISSKEIMKETGEFFIFVGNYVDGIKQGEFKLFKGFNSSNGQTELGLLASINYLNDTINGNLTFINKDLRLSYIEEEQNYTTVLMSQNKISDQKIQIFPKRSEFIFFKNNNLDSGYINKYYFKKLNSPGEYNLTFFHKDRYDGFDNNGKTILRVSNGNKFLEINNELDFDNLKCVGVCVTKDRYTTFSINDSKFTGFINCYYLNDSLNYSINTTNGQIDIWTDLAIDKKIKILRFPDFPEIKFDLFNLLRGSMFLSDEANLSIEQYNTGYFKIAEIKNMSFSNLDGYGRSKNILTWSEKNPFSIDYKIGEHIFRTESWDKISSIYLRMQFTNFNLNGNVLNSSDMVKNKEAIKRIEEEKEYKRIFGIKDDDAVVSCAFCKKTYVKKNGEAIKVAVCNSTSILCLNANGIPCEWTFCSMKCTNDFQCSQCAQSKAYRSNCR